jgi:hypothetical protein
MTRWGSRGSLASASTFSPSAFAQARKARTAFRYVQTVFLLSWPLLPPVSSSSDEKRSRSLVLSSDGSTMPVRSHQGTKTPRRG